MDAAAINRILEQIGRVSETRAYPILVGFTFPIAASFRIPFWGFANPESLCVCKHSAFCSLTCWSLELPSGNPRQNPPPCFPLPATYVLSTRFYLPKIPYAEMLLSIVFEGSLGAWRFLGAQSMLRFSARFQLRIPSGATCSTGRLVAYYILKNYERRKRAADFHLGPRTPDWNCFLKPPRRISYQPHLRQSKVRFSLVRELVDGGVDPIPTTTLHRPNTYSTPFAIEVGGN